MFLLRILGVLDLSLNLDLDVRANLGFGYFWLLDVFRLDCTFLLPQLMLIGNIFKLLLFLIDLDGGFLLRVGSFLLDLELGFLFYLDCRYFLLSLTVGYFLF